MFYSVDELTKSSFCHLIDLVTLMIKNSDAKINLEYFKKDTELTYDQIYNKILNLVFSG